MNSSIQNKEFAGFVNGSTFTANNGQNYQISYFDDASTGGFELSGGNDISLMAVPEPNVAVTLLGGLGMLLGLRRRRRAMPKISPHPCGEGTRQVS